MRLPRPPSPDSIRPRPARGADIAFGMEDEPEEIEFDPNKDITKESWDGMKDELEENRLKKKWFEFSDNAMHLSLLFPQRKSELNLNDEAFEGMKWELERYRNVEENRVLFGFMAMRLYLLFPDRKAELNLNDEVFDVMKGELERRRCNGNWRDFCFPAMYIAILFPERKSELNLNNEAFEGMQVYLEECRRKRNWWNFELAALSLSILAAERAEIVNGQIVIIPKQPKLTREPKPLPERLAL